MVITVSLVIKKSIPPGAKCADGCHKEGSDMKEKISVVLFHFGAGRGMEDFVQNNRMKIVYVPQLVNVRLGWFQNINHRLLCL